jgi:hypothetical protein
MKTIQWTTLLSLTVISLALWAPGCATTSETTASRAPDSVACSGDSDSQECTNARQEEHPTQRYIGIMETRGGI